MSARSVKRPVGSGGCGRRRPGLNRESGTTIPHTIPLMLMVNETFDMGLDNQSTVDFTYESPFQFTDTIDKLNYKLGPEQLTAEDKQKAAEMLARARD